MAATIEQLNRLVRELRGAPICILIVLYPLRQRVSQDYLISSTGYTDKPMRYALNYLVNIGFLNHTSEGWALTHEARRLPFLLPLGVLEGEGQEKDSPPVSLQVAQDDAVLPAPQQAVQGDAVLPALQNTKQDEQTSESGIIQEILNYSESSITTTITTTTLKNQFDHTEGLKVVVVDGEILNYSGFEPEDDPPDELFAEKLAVLQQCSIAEPMRSRLARREELSALRILALHLDLKRWKKERYSPGLLIYALEHDQEPSQDALRDADLKLRGYFGSPGGCSDAGYAENDDEQETWEDQDGDAEDTDEADNEDYSEGCNDAPEQAEDSDAVYEAIADRDCGEAHQVAQVEQLSPNLARYVLPGFPLYSPENTSLKRTKGA